MTSTKPRGPADRRLLLPPAAGSDLDDDHDLAVMGIMLRMMTMVEGITYNANLFAATIPSTASAFPSAVARCPDACAAVISCRRGAGRRSRHQRKRKRNSGSEGYYRGWIASYDAVGAPVITNTSFGAGANGAEVWIAAYQSGNSDHHPSNCNGSGASWSAPATG